MNDNQLLLMQIAQNAEYTRRIMDMLAMQRWVRRGLWLLALAALGVGYLIGHANPLGSMPVGSLCW
jgi:hypothetical protein